MDASATEVLNAPSLPEAKTVGAASTLVEPDGDIQSSALVKWTIVLAVATVILALSSTWAIFQTRHDARELLSVRISNELDKQFDSAEFRHSRAQFAAALRDHREPKDYRVLDFLEKAALYVRHGAIDDDTAYSQFSYYVERYWLASRDLIRTYREREKDPGYYDDLEDYYKSLTKSGKRSERPDEIQIQAFLREETELE